MNTDRTAEQLDQAAAAAVFTIMGKIYILIKAGSKLMAHTRGKESTHV